MAGRGVGRVLLGSGLLVVTLLGGAGGYGAGRLTNSTEAGGAAAMPLAPATTTAQTTPTPSPTPTPPKLALDDSEPLRADEIEYRTRAFTVTSVVASHVSLRVPERWEMVQLVPPKDMRFNEPERKRAVRVQGGFTINRSPAESLSVRIDQLKALTVDKAITIKSDVVDPKSGDATLAYTYADRGYLKYAVIRWVANPKKLCILEIAVTGLPQDRAALLAVLDEASGSATRSDSPA
ncbi:hypothetical protein [Kribbella sp. CA-293567]|uniref:hypothetical protein n=1 Tax=Kribbella sp. CA-293567 TaxID=3002436 RepID=UPI0022DD7112|nr:hypothetical protein [Kribbella sp. CA-293567]WBQ05944.1 hypothetical protein OX958_03865 [Kribbella sp. CA-293567]